MIRLPQTFELVPNRGGKVCVVGREAELAAFGLATLLQPLADDLLDLETEGTRYSRSESVKLLLLSQVKDRAGKSSESDDSAFMLGGMLPTKVLHMVSA